MEKTESINKKATKLIKVRDTKDRAATFYKPFTCIPLIEIKKKTSQQQGKDKPSILSLKGNRLGCEGEARARVRLDELKNKFINLLMRNGEKSKAYKLFAESLNQLQKKTLPIPCIPSLKNFSLVNNEKEGIRGRESTPYPFLCENRAELVQLYTEKNKKAFQEPQKTKQLYTDQKQRSIPYFDRDKKKIIIKGNQMDSINKGKDKPCIPSLKGNRLNREGNAKAPYVEQNYYNDFLKNSTLYQAVENVKPTLELRRVRKGGTTYQVPAIVNQKRQERLAIKWIIESAEKRKKKNKTSFSDCLVSEILEAFNKTGQPRQRRDEQLKIAEFNRAYTRYRWW